MKLRQHTTARGQWEIGTHNINHRYLSIYRVFKATLTRISLRCLIIRKCASRDRIQVGCLASVDMKLSGEWAHKEECNWALRATPTPFSIYFFIKPIHKYASLYYKHPDRSVTEFLRKIKKPFNSRFTFTISAVEHECSDISLI